MFVREFARVIEGFFGTGILGVEEELGETGDEVVKLLVWLTEEL